MNNNNLLIVFVVILLFFIIFSGTVGYFLGKSMSSVSQSQQQLIPQSQKSQDKQGNTNNFSQDPSLQPIPAGKCGDNVCGPVETQLGVCPQDCDKTNTGQNTQSNNPTKPTNSYPFQPDNQ